MRVGGQRIGEGRARRGRATTALARFALGASTVVLLATVLSPATAGATSCPTIPWKDLTVAHEIINIGTVYTHPQAALPTYKGAGTNPIPDDVWNAGYEPPSPYTANTTRNLQFNESQFIASPGEPICKTSYVTTSDGYTWGAMSMAINAMTPYRSSDYTGLPARNAYYAGNLVTTPSPGVVKGTANFKAQNIEFWARQNDSSSGSPIMRYFVRDRWGNVYIMHASAQDTPQGVQQAFDDAVLPKGWTKFEHPLRKDLIIRPAEGSDGSFHYLVVRDSADNSYHQIRWSNRGALQAHVEGRAMPIWGGQDANVVTGTRRVDVIHGAAGNDVLRPLTGNDKVWGDAGVDTVVLPGNSGKYRLKRLSKKRKTVVVSGFGRRTIKYAEKLRFENETLGVSSLGPRDVGKRL